MTSILDKLRDWLGGVTPAPETADPARHSVPLDDAAVEKLMIALSMTRDDELSCAEVYALIDEYTELAVTDRDKAAVLMPLVEMHLEICTDCHEAYDVLHMMLDPQEDHPASNAG